MTSEWHEVPLRELVGYISKGIAPSYAEEASETTIRVLNQKCNRNFRISYGDSRLHDTLKKKVPPERYVKPDDILINSTGAGTAGRIAQIEDVPSATTIDGHMILIRSNGKVTQKFLGYALKAHQWEVLQLDEGSTGQTELNRDRLLDEIMINYPVSFDEQNAIVGTLESIDRKLIVNKEINDNLQRQLRTIFKAEFTDNPELENITQIPLSELCHVVTKGTTPTTLGKPFVESGINFIKAESILDDHSIDKSKFAFIDEETNALLKRSIIHAGDVVFTIAGTLGRFALIDENVLPANTNQAVAIIRADLEKVLPEYIYTCFIGEWHTDYYAKRVQQAVQANLSLTTIKSLPIPLLDEAKMSEYLSLILPLIKAIKTNEAQNEKLAALRDNLLPKLMSGEIDVSAVQL